MAVRYTDNLKTMTLAIKLKKGQKISIGDKVEFRKSYKGKTGSEYARVTKVINKDVYYITGFFEPKRNYAKVFPDSRKIKTDVIVRRNDFKGAVYGDKVVCEIINVDDIEDGIVDLEARVVEVLGKAGDTLVEVKSVMKKYSFEDFFSEDILSETTDIFREYKSKSEKGVIDGYRRDLRTMTLFTIDPKDAKDFDDAVSIEKSGDGYKLGVHIADVSHFVKDGCAVDIEAFKRATSVYFPNKVVPMLPEILSNDLCSLKPNVDRLAFSVFIELGKKFEVKNYELTKSIINSKRRFTYEEVQEIINKKKGDYSKDILLMYRVSQSLTKKRITEGSIDFDSREVEFEIDKKGFIKSIGIKDRLDSMRMIEEFMLLANRCVTEFVNKLSLKIRAELPFVYRVHDLPDAEKLQNLSEFIRQFGHKANLKDKNEIKRLLEEIKGEPEEFIINDLLIRSMAKAVYTDENIGHYGLGFENYTHFTSPIRRYPDLIVHRLLFEYTNFLNGRTQKIDLHPRYRDSLEEMCKHCSVQEQNAVAAEREVTKILQIEFIKDKLGDDFDGIISGIGKFGLFIELIDFKIEGMVRYRDIEDDYYEYDERRHCAVGKRKGREFHAGSKIKVKLISADTSSRKIDFVIIK
ncbi:MAG: ribonuclease R [Bacteroidetes bacterium]|nr:ribonuclease R [Bacteroidota bacterium]